MQITFGVENCCTPEHLPVPPRENSGPLMNAADISSLLVCLVKTHSKMET